VLFNSPLFMFFFITVYGLYRWMKGRRQQNVLLLAASYIFYAAWDWRFLFLILLNTVVHFAAATLIASSGSPRRRKLLLVAAVGASLGVLGFFKYWNFGAEAMAALLGSVGLRAHLPTLDIILPVGISFYTFQAIGYTVDVYRREIGPARSALDFALFVSFFPQLVAGPIERARDLLPQLERPRRVTREDVRLGLWWLALGYFKKVVLADTLAPFVDYAFANPDVVGGVTSLAGLVGFAVQIYGDFAGYSMIARGLARLMGIRLVENFRMPYLATDPRDFWRRWHVSLSTWMRDYVYIPLGGSRSGRARTCVSLMATMVLGGLWHGAGWNFVIWGAYHGALVALCRLVEPNGCPKGISLPRRAVRTVITFVLVLFGWLIFRARSMGQLAAILANILGDFRWTIEAGRYVLPATTLLGLLLAYHAWLERAGDTCALARTGRGPRVGAFTFLVLATVAVGFRATPFIYFQF
jgi:D-alanyl-lipoteichoic acid acyltransferase DltB (MBOAT superfamily)